MLRTNGLAVIPVVILGMVVGYAMRAGPFTHAQISEGAGAIPPVWETTTPAAPLVRGSRTLWPNQPDQVTHWSIDDIRKAHQTLAEAEIAGRTVEPNSALHDFPYWTRTHSMFIRHVAQDSGDPIAEQHLGYAQAIVIMGGEGVLEAGGQIDGPSVLTEQGRQVSGELRGTSIVGADTFALGEGDIVSIPPDTPARFVSSTPGGMTYMVMKVNAMLYPWELIR